MSNPPARLGLVAIFCSTFLELVGYFMLLPLLLLRLKDADVSTSVAGLFAATGWAGIFLFTPFASWIAQKIGRRPTLWLAAAIPALASLGFALTDSLPVWFALELLTGAAAGLRWVLAEAVVAEFSAPQQRGRNIGLFETMVGTTFIIGPALLVWIGPMEAAAFWVVTAFMVSGLLLSLLIPLLPAAPDNQQTTVGVRGVWQALRLHPIIMLAGFVGGFFESGITSILPLYGLALGLGAAGAALLVSASGLG
ncbi:MAG: MFS transporter, partial [Rhodoferax sp.]|nr:MFS transporter [Rhodoferax sp.]